MAERTQYMTQHGRPIYDAGDGSYYSERSRTVVTPEGLVYNVPTVLADGYILPEDLSDDELMYMYEQWGWRDPVTGALLPAFNSIDAAERAAIRRSEEMRYIPLNRGR